VPWYLRSSTRLFGNTRLVYSQRLGRRRRGRGGCGGCLSWALVAVVVLLALRGCGAS
jgi:hypothetical protein